MTQGTETFADSRIRVSGDGGHEGSSKAKPLSIPDVVLLIRFGLTDEQHGAIRESLTQQARANGYASPGIHFAQSTSTALTRVGMWLGGAAADVLDDAKRRGFDRTAAAMRFPDTNVWALSVNWGTIEREVDRQWASGSIARHYSSDGTPCYGADCDIDIDEPSVYFKDLDFPLNPRRDRVYTMVRGKYNPAFPDIGFLAVTTDVFGVQDGKVTITSSTEVEKDTNILNVLTTIFVVVGAIYAAAFGGLAAVAPFLAAGVFGVEDTVVRIVGGGTFPGVGAFLTTHFFPGDLTLPGLPKLKLNYNVFEVGDAIVTASGTVSAGFPSGMRSQVLAGGVRIG